MAADDYIRRATVLRVVDGDTLDVEVDLGFDISHKMRLRLDGIDAPERYTAGGKIATNWLLERLTSRVQIVIKTKKDKQEKFGRYLAEVFLLGDSVSLNAQMMQADLAKEYHGGKR